ncbi:MAG: hypothetical protein Q8Q06_01585 [bacterium]|nr:hypothetical protein [bacterium]
MDKHEYIYKHKPHSKGSALVLSVLIVNTLLSMAIVLTLIFVPKIKVSTNIKNSVSAIYAADSGIEYCLYVNRVDSVSAPTLNNGATYTVIPSDCSTTTIRAIGEKDGTTRSLEVTF